MGADELVAAVGRARAGVVAAQSKLVNPTAEAVDEGAAILEHAVGVFEAALKPLEGGGLSSPGSGHHGLRSALESLRREIGRLQALLEGAAALRLGFARMLYAAAGGYDCRGEPAAPELARRVVVEG